MSFMGDVIGTCGEPGGCGVDGKLDDNGPNESGV